MKNKIPAIVRHEAERHEIKKQMAILVLAFEEKAKPLREKLYAVSRKISAINAKERKKTP